MNDPVTDMSSRYWYKFGCLTSRTALKFHHSTKKGVGCGNSRYVLNIFCIRYLILWVHLLKVLFSNARNLLITSGVPAAFLRRNLENAYIS